MRKQLSFGLLLFVVIFSITTSFVGAEIQRVVQVEPDKEIEYIVEKVIMPLNTLSSVGDEQLLNELKKQYREERKATAPLKISPIMLIDQKETCAEYNMFDHSPLTGFIDDWGYCVPGLVTNEVWFTKSKQYVYGTAVLYSPGMMRATATWREMQQVAYGKDSGYLGGVATASPADIGETVWLRREGLEWEGPYLVVDCSRRADMVTHIAINQQVVEVDFDTAVRWGMAHYTKDWWAIDQHREQPVEVFYGLEKPSEDIRETRNPIFYPEYWFENIVEYQREKIEPSPYLIQKGINPIWDLRDGNGSQCFTTACSNE